MNAQLCLWLIFPGIVVAPPDGPTELAKLASSMKPGTWAELKTKGYGTELLKVQNHHILEYTDTAVYALNLKQNEWRQLPDAPISEGVAASIDTYGVTMYFANRPAKVFLYKHAQR